MAKREIFFNGEAYSIEESVLEASLAEMKSRLVDDYSGSGTTIIYDGTAINVDSTKLAAAASNLAATLNRFAGSGTSIVVNGIEYGVDSAKITNAVTKFETVLGELQSGAGEGGDSNETQIEPGLYETGAIALLNAGNKDQAAAMLKTSWSDLVSNGVIVVDNGTVSIGRVMPDLPAKNEYGFYYGVPYSDGQYGFAFCEDGAVKVYDGNELIETTPTGSAVYSLNTIDFDGMVVTVSSEGTRLVNEDGFELVLGSTHQLDGDLIMPNDGSITAMSDSAFVAQKSLTGITISNSLSSISDNAFYGCTALTNVTISDSVTSIGWQAFYNCESLTSVEFGENSQLATIGEAAFIYCYGLTSIEIPAGVTSMGNHAFADSGLTNLEVPESITHIGEYAFFNCVDLVSVTFAEGCQLKNIQTHTFSYCENLASVTFGNSSQLATIDAYAFANCTGLTSIKIPAGVTSIGEHAFDKSGLTSVEISASVTTIEQMAFYSCSNLASVKFADNSQLTTLGYAAFMSCYNLTSIKIPAGVISIGDASFERCWSLKSVDIPASVTFIGHRAFMDCTGLTRVKFADNSQLTTLEGGAFSGCSSLETIRIPAGVTSIKNLTFYNCSKLKSVFVPAGLTTLAHDAFSKCIKLNTFIFEGTVDQWNSVSKADYWTQGIPVTVIQCSDGQVTL